MKKSFHLIITACAFLLGWQVWAFSDVPWDTAVYRAVSYMAERGIISGYDDGSFGIDDPITKAAALKVILSAAEVEIPEETIVPDHFYTDVPEDAWFTPFIVTALNELILKIDPEDTNPEFNPGNEVNRAAFIKMMLSTFGVDPGRFNLEGVEITDVPEDAWFAPYMKFAAKFDILDLTETGEALPSQTITRGETVQYLYRTLKQGGGLNPQTLLVLTESHLVQTIEKIDAKQFSGAGLAVDIAEKFVDLALKILPENTIVQSAHKTVLAVKHLVGAFAAGEMGRLNEVLENTGNAWNLASEAGELNPGQATMAEAIKHLAHELATRTREVQEKVEVEKAKLTAEGKDINDIVETKSEESTTDVTIETSEEVTEEVSEVTPEHEEEVVVEESASPQEELSEEDKLLKQLEEIRAKKEAAAIEAKKQAEAEAAAKKKAQEEAAAKAAEAKEEEAATADATPAPATKSDNSSVQNAIIKAQLAALTPVLAQIGEDDPMKAVVTAQLVALEQVLLQANFNKDLVIAQLGALEPVIGALQNEGLKNIVLAQLGALKQVVSSLK